jgi:hypothetical protein
MEFFDFILGLLGIPGGSEGRVGRYERIGCLVGLPLVGLAILFIVISLWTGE